MDKSLPIFMACNAERTWRRIEPLKLIKHGFLITPLLMGNAYAAGEPIYNFNLPAQPLSATLDSVARSSHIKLIYADATVKGMRAAPVKGKYNAQQALDIALGKSGLDYKVVDEALITVTGKPAAAAPAAVPPASVITLKPMTVVGEAVQDPNDPYNESYAVTNSFTATKTDTPIMETPMSVEVVTQQVLKDQQAWRLEDATKNVSGVQPVSTVAQYQDFVIRGFGTQYTRYRNGVRLPESSFDMANVEQVEVLKGGSAMLYGRTEPGGMINVITKKPLDLPYYSLQQQFGSYDFYRTTLDATGPITKDGSLAYRFNLGYLNSNSFRDFIEKERIFIAPSLHWQASADTEFNLNVEYRYDNPSMTDTGIPAIGNRVANVPISRNYGQPGQFNKDTIESTLIDFNWSHIFNDHWKISNAVVANLVDYEFRDIPVAFVQTQLGGG